MSAGDSLGVGKAMAGTEFGLRLGWVLMVVLALFAVGWLLGGLVPAV